MVTHMMPVVMIFEDTGNIAGCGEYAPLHQTAFFGIRLHSFSVKGVYLFSFCPINLIHIAQILMGFQE